MYKKEEEQVLILSQDQILSNIIEQTQHSRNINLTQVKKDLLNVEYTDDVIEQLLKINAKNLGFTNIEVLLNPDTTIEIDECDADKVVEYAEKQGFRTYDPNQSEKELDKLKDIKQRLNKFINSSEDLHTIIHDQGYIKTASNKIILFGIKEEDGSLDTPYKRNKTNSIIWNPDDNSESSDKKETRIIPFGNNGTNVAKFVKDEVIFLTLEATIESDKKQIYTVTDIAQELFYINRKVSSNIRTSNRSIVVLNNIIEQLDISHIWKNINESNEKLKNEIDHDNKKTLKEEIEKGVNNIIQVKELGSNTTENFTRIKFGHTILFKSYKDILTKFNEENHIIEIIKGVESIDSQPFASHSKCHITRNGFTRSVSKKREDNKLTLIFPTFTQTGPSVNQVLSRDNLIHCFNNTKLDEIYTIKIIFPFNVPCHWLTVEMSLELRKGKYEVFCHDNISSSGSKLTRDEQTEIKLFIDYLIQNSLLDTKSCHENNDQYSVDVKFEKSKFCKIKRSSHLNCGPATVLDICNLAQEKALKGICDKDNQAIETRINHMDLINKYTHDPYERQVMLATLLPPQVKKDTQNRQLVESKSGLTPLNIFIYICMFCSMAGILSVSVALFTQPKNNLSSPLALCFFIIVLLTSILGKVCQKPNNKIVPIEVQQVNEKGSQLTT